MDLKEPGCKPSPSAKSNHTAAQFCESTGPMPPATTMCEPSPQNALEQTEFPLMSFAEDSHAKTSAQREKARGLQESAASYSTKLPDLLANWDQDTSSWRTSQLCLVEGLTKFSGLWPRSGMMRSGIAYQLPPLAPLTGETESGLWPTPTRHNAKEMGYPAEYTRKSVGLGSIVLRKTLWPTPSASDNRDRGNLSSPAIASRVKKGKQLMLSMVVSDKSGSLNPTWVEWLMGFPTGWTALKPSETPSSRKFQKSLGGQ